MRFLVLLIASLAEPLLTQAELRQIQALAPTWKAGIPERLKSLTKSDFKRMLSADSPRTQPSMVRPIHVPESEDPAPDHFDFREEYPQCITEVIDIGLCSSSWAHSAVDAFSHRRCLTGLDQEATRYSAQYILSCASTNGCFGFSTQGDIAWDFIATTGVPLESCVKYTDYNETQSSWPCPSVCNDNSFLEIYKPDGYEGVGFNSERLKRAVAFRGPMQAMFAVYEDFTYYLEGIYSHTYGNRAGFLSVEIVGYGTSDEGQDYWIVKNYWGPDWGEDGYFRIVRGQDECQIEEATYGAIINSDKPSTIAK
ncbi:Cathepsin B precursor [Giardia lamblia P15]|uniref:Cathepsin B n=1 Tax=Giardia intestinalis (strain P15) TaxID=658858 RepID=E1EVX1_GIAIA|nr:Cathepsin B precursor [Giardia lamblia P15]